MEMSGRLSSIAPNFRMSGPKHSPAVSRSDLITLAVTTSPATQEGLFAVSVEYERHKQPRSNYHQQRFNDQ